MWVWRESWCFCNGRAKSEKMKGSIFSSKSLAMARIGSGGSGLLIHRNLLLTTHANIPSLEAAQAAEIHLRSGATASLVPHRFFISSSVLDLTIVGIDVMDENTPLRPPHYIKTSSKPNLDLGDEVYLLGYAEKNELVSGDGKVVIATDNLIKLSTDGIAWSPGSAGFDSHGNLAFLVCDPMKLATSPNTKSSSRSSFSSTSRKKEHPTQFGIPIPVICDWVNQHWEGNLDDLSKPKLPLTRLVSGRSGGQKTDHSSASFTMRQVFKSSESEDEDTMTSRDPAPGWSGGQKTDHASFTMGQVFKSSESEDGDTMTSRNPAPAREHDSAQLRLVDVNIPPRSAKSSNSLQAAIRILQHPNEDFFDKSASAREDQSSNGECPFPMADANSTNGAQSEVYSSSSPNAMSGINEYYSSDGETTMYSAETAESRNYPSPKGGRSQHVGRSQSCLNYNRWQRPVQKIPAPAAHRTSLEKQRNSMSGSKVFSPGTTTQRSNDYFSPTVSSIMKKRNSAELPKPRVSTELPTRLRPTALPSSPRWIF